MVPNLAKPSSEVIAAVEITNMCEALGVLPYSGGLLDQPAQMVIRMQAVMIAHQEKREKEMEKSKRGSSNKRT